MKPQLSSYANSHKLISLLGFKPAEGKLKVPMQPIDIVRRTPSQARAAETVDTLFEATAQILERENAERLTTNHIAKRAGFSIGTLYGYFPNKGSLLHAMALREVERQQIHALEALSEAGPNSSAEELVRIVVRAVLRPFGGRSRLRMAMMKLLVKYPGVFEAASSMQHQVIRILLQKIAQRTNRIIAEPNTDTHFTLYAAVSGAIKTAAVERPDIFETKAFEDNIVELILPFLKRL
jgi:AcrR family transcriptional regulator